MRIIVILIMLLCSTTYAANSEVGNGKPLEMRPINCVQKDYRVAQAAWYAGINRCWVYQTGCTKDGSSIISLICQRWSVGGRFFVPWVIT